MHTLADLFTDERQPNDDTPARLDSAAERARMTALVGPPRVEIVPVSERDDTPELIATVNDAARTASPVLVAGASGAPKLPRRGHKRTDWLNVSFAVLAVAIVGAVGTFGAIQLANASPAASALRALTVDEASLANGQQAVEAGNARIEALIAEARADADTAEPALAAVAGYTDEPVRAAAVQGVTDLRAALDAVELPDVPSAYARPSIDTDDLGQVGAQIDAVRERSESLIGLTEEMRTVRAEVIALREAFGASVVALGGTFSAAATEAINENIEAPQSFRDAVQNAAAAIPAAQAAGGLGAAEMVAYPPLVDALREAHDEAIQAIITAEERARQEYVRQQQQTYTPPSSGGGSSGQSGGEGDTGGGETEPPATEAPVEPAPVEPVEPPAEEVPAP